MAAPIVRKGDYLHRIAPGMHANPPDDVVWSRRVKRNGGN